MYYPFPYKKIKKSSKIILYGAGAAGQYYFRENQSSEFVIMFAVDQNYEQYQHLAMQVYPIEKIVETDYDYVVISIQNSEIQKDVKRLLLDTYGVKSSQILLCRAGVLDRFMDWLVAIDLHRYPMSNYEERQFKLFIKKIISEKHICALDVGCGYGRNMRLLQELGVSVDGVDINAHIVDENRKNKFVCYTIDEFCSNQKQRKKMYDCIIFSHIIEHFSPTDLKKFIENYLQYLKSNGFLLIATPILWTGFYRDFDHIKMYHPGGIDMVFGNSNAQVQYYSSSQLKMEDIWFRKTPHQLDYKHGLYVYDSYSWIWKGINLFYRLLYRVSRGILGQTTGWMGLYRKM